MTQVTMQNYTNRITNGNRSEIVVVMFDIFFTYLDDAKMALSEEKDYEAATKSLRSAGQVMEHLKDALDFTYPISADLYRIYDFAERQVAKAMYLGDPDFIDEIAKVVQPIAEAFAEVAKQDSSDKMMKNTQEVVAGYTYGRNDVNEAMMDYNGSRGFMV